MKQSSVPCTLTEATQRVRGIGGICLLDEWEWCSEERLWALHCRITVEVPQNSPVPASTDWHVLVSNLYPDGSIQFFPAKEGGLKGLFPHQYPTSVSKSKPWTGDFLCLDGHLLALDRIGAASGPRDWRRRLKWTFERAIEWLQRAARDDLVRQGDHFELPFHQPQRNGNALGMVIVSEGSKDLPVWNKSSNCGLLDFRRIGERSLVVHAFRDQNNRVIRELDWGAQIIGHPIVRSCGIWVRLDSLPVLPPWQQPQTWGELRRACPSIRIDNLIKRMVLRFPRGEPITLLIGAPIPEIVGGQANVLYWQSLLLPCVRDEYRGFQTKSRWRAYRQRHLGDNKRLPWMTTDNWHPDRLSSRGRLPIFLRNKKVVLIGVGALGAPLAEHLVRGGVTDITLIDHDKLDAGNLVRHPLTMEKIESPKADALKDRLNWISPHARAEAISKGFSPDLEQAEQIREADLIIDATASDEVIAQLNSFGWNQSKHFVSLSIGMKARQLYAYSAHGQYFPLDDFHSIIGPYVQSERKRLKDDDIKWEGVGCYHPVFEARSDDMGLWASVATKLIVQFVTNPSPTADFIVLEQSSDSGIPRILHRNPPVSRND